MNTSSNTITITNDMEKDALYLIQKCVAIT